MEVYLTWQFWYQVLSAFAFGVASSLVPVLNSELFVVGALGSRLLGPLEVALGLALGHGVGKQVMFVGIRKGSNSRWIKHKEPKPVAVGSWRWRLRRWNDQAAHIVETPRRGMPLLFFSAITGIPPVYLVVIYAATTKMNFWWFFVGDAWILYTMLLASLSNPVWIPLHYLNIRV